MPSIVRCGVGKNIHERVNHVSLETLVAQKRGLASATHGVCMMCDECQGGYDVVGMHGRVGGMHGV